MTEHKFTQSPLAKVSSLSWGVKGRRPYVHLAAGIDKPTRGRITFSETTSRSSVSKELARWRSENIGFVFQTFNLIPLFTHDPRAAKFAHSTRHLEKGQLLPEGRLPAD